MSPGRKPKPKPAPEPAPTPVPTPVPTAGISGPGLALPNESAFRKGMAPDLAELDDCKLLGAKHLRLDLGWQWNVAYTQLVDATLARGMKVLAQIGSTGVNALGVNGAKYDPTSFLKVVDSIVPQLAARGVTDIELGNEWNAHGYTPAMYLEDCQAAYPRIKALHPAARVFVGAAGLASGAVAAFDWVKQLFPAVNGCCDVFSIHAANRPDDVADWSMQWHTFKPGGIRDLLDASKPIALTEYNWPVDRPDQPTQADNVVANMTDPRYVATSNFTPWAWQDASGDFGMKGRLVWDAYRAAVAA